jgi:hypothetical protein
VRLVYPSDRDLAWLGWRRRAGTWSAVAFGRTAVAAGRALDAVLASERHSGAGVVLRAGQRPEDLLRGKRVEQWSFGLKRTDPAYEVWAEWCGATLPVCEYAKGW